MLQTLAICVLFLISLSQAQTRGSLPAAGGAGRQGKSGAANPGTPASATPQMTVPGAPAKPAAPEVAPDAAVITLKGLCAKAEKMEGKSCATNITRDKFEDVLDAHSLSGQAFAPGAIRMIADNYVQNLILADAALKNGVDKDPRVQELLEIVRTRTLAEAYRHSMEQKYRTPPPEEIEKYYQQNLSKYEAVKADRIFVPRMNPKSPREGAQEFEKKAEALANELHKRAAAGEPADKLQNEAFLKLGLPAPALLPDTGLRRRASFPGNVEPDVFALKPGEVTKVENETGGFAIYRLFAKDTYSSEQVKGEIVRDIYKQKMEAAIKGVLQSVQAEFNDQYFAPAITAQPAELSGKPPGAAPATHSAPRVQSNRSVKLPPAQGTQAVQPGAATPK